MWFVSVLIIICILINNFTQNRYYLHRGLSPLSWKSQTDFFGPQDVSDPPLFVIGKFELKARSVGLILYVDNNQKNNYVRLHLNHFKFMAQRQNKEYLDMNDHTQLIEDNINVYFGIDDDEFDDYDDDIIASSSKKDQKQQQQQQKKKNKIEHGLYVVPIQYLDSHSSHNNNTGHTTKDLIAVPLCHIHYNAKTNCDDFSVRDTFEAKWGNQTFILPLDLRPFDNIGKTFKKYHRDYNEIITKHKKQKQQQKEINDDDSLKTINEKEEQNNGNGHGGHQKSQTSQSISLSSQYSHQSVNKSNNNDNNNNTNNNNNNNQKRTFTHDRYKFEPPFPSVKYIVSTETILEKLGIKTPQNTIPQTFYSSIIEPISSSFRVIRGVSQQIDSKLSPLADDQQ